MTIMPAYAGFFLRDFPIVEREGSKNADVVGIDVFYQPLNAADCVGIVQERGLRK